jgi:DUF4097 and DUF4098 domain-containing protein YvlB
MIRTTMRRLAPGYLALALLAMPAQGETVIREFDADPGERLTIELETGGAVRIQGGGSGVRVEAEYRDAIHVEMERTSDGVRITSAYESRQNRNRGGVDLEIEVPDRFDIRVETLGGEIVIDGVEGEMEGETMGGELVLRNLRGTVHISTMGGEITLRDSEVDGKVSTMGGDVRVENVRGNVRAETMGGEVTFVDVQPGPVSSADCNPQRIMTMGGDIKAPDAECGADLETMGGNISIGRVGEYLQAETMGGNIDVAELNGWARVTTMGGNISVTMTDGGGKRDVTLSSMGGTVTLLVPEGLSMNVDITLAYTKKSRKGYQIESDFPLQIQMTDDWEYRDGSPRKYVYGTGEINGGEHRIKIETVNGDVRLLKTR